MGCLNDDDRWKHWFANIHLSGPCNRRCYFCIGQHMMAVDSLNTLHRFPLPGLSEFVNRVLDKGIKEVDVTGTNTDPLLYDHTEKIAGFLRTFIPGVTLGVRTNGAQHADRLRFYDKGSITICSTDYHRNLEIMGGPPPDLGYLADYADLSKFKVNMVLTPETARFDEAVEMARLASMWGITRINLREPYGQPHIGCAFMGKPGGSVLQDTVPYWDFPGMNVRVFYWDVHTVAVRSVNVYANGRVSETYPITKGYDPSGEVKRQEDFPMVGRHNAQWVS